MIAIMADPAHPVPDMSHQMPFAPDGLHTLPTLYPPDLPLPPLAPHANRLSLGQQMELMRALEADGSREITPMVEASNAIFYPRGTAQV